MRADRLISVLLLLQRRPSGITAAEVAAELEVSERTARRDLEALGASGLPVYSVAGRGGGWRLLGGAKTDLTGLTASEMRALFAVAGPRVETSPALKTAVRKLTRALPEPLREDAEVLARSIVVEPVGWHESSAARDPDSLDDVQRAISRSRELDIDYVSGVGESTSRTIRPLGLAMKGTRWYVVADTDNGQRTFRVDRMRRVEITDRKFSPPPGFVLADAWREIADGIGELGKRASATILVRAGELNTMRSVLRGSLRIGPPVRAGWVRCEVRGFSLRAIAGQIAGFGEAVTVEEPDALRRILHDIGTQLTAMNSVGSLSTR